MTKARVVANECSGFDRNNILGTKQHITSWFDFQKHSQHGIKDSQGQAQCEIVSVSSLWFLFSWNQEADREPISRLGILLIQSKVLELFKLKPMLLSLIRLLDANPLLVLVSSAFHSYYFSWASCILRGMTYLQIKHRIFNFLNCTWFRII